MTKTYKIFISHFWTYVNDLKLLRNLLESRGYFCVEFPEFPPTDSVNSMNTYYIRQRISERIAISDIVLGIAGIYASYSDWMKWELDKAAEKGIPIIGVIPRGQERIFSIVSNRAIEIVYWNTESIVYRCSNSSPRYSVRTTMPPLFALKISQVFIRKR